MTNVQLKPNAQNSKQIYDLEERTAIFGERIIDFVKTLPHTITMRPLASQLVRSGTSIGANYSEADEASSKKDFINKMNIANKEIKETRYWLRMIVHAFPESREQSIFLIQEARELNLIFSTIIRKGKESEKLVH